MTLLSGSRASAFARVALANVAREYPRKVDHLLLAAAAELTPRRVHPVFSGSYDWHSAMHMHWLLARLPPALPAAWPERDARRVACQTAAQRHFAAALPQIVGGDCVGEHWLASFAALAMGESP